MKCAGKGLTGEGFSRRRVEAGGGEVTYEAKAEIENKAGNDLRDVAEVESAATERGGKNRR